MYQHENLISGLREDIRSCKENGKRVFYLMPAVFRADTRAFYEGVIDELLELELDGFVVKSY